MTLAENIACLIPVTYLLGSVPFGLVIAKSRGVDPRKSGSGNIGASNVGRLLGKRFFFLVFFLDLLKSLVPMLIASWLAHRVGLADRGPAIYWLWLAVGTAAVLGHLFSVFLRFKGGKGVATSFGFILGLVPYFTLPAVGALVAFLIAFLITRTISIGSLTAAVALPLTYIGIGLPMGWDPFGRQLPLTIVSTVLSALIFYTHRTNIRRIINGTEKRYSTKTADARA